MKWLVGAFIVFLGAPVAFLLFFASSEGAVAQCAENAIPAVPTYTVSGDQIDYANDLVEAAPRELTSPEAGVIFTLAAHATNLMPKSRVDPMTGDAATTTAGASIAAILERLHVLDGWDTKPPATTAALLLETDPEDLAGAWDEAYGLLYEIDPQTAAMLDAVTRTGSVCGTAMGVAIDAGDLVVVDGFTNPLPGAYVTSGFGYRIHPIYGYRKLHAGTDFAYGAGQTCNRPIVAAAEGDVVFAGAAAGYGHVIMVNHPDGIQTRYAHMFEQGVLAQAGDHVSAGQVIGLVGSDGASTACHLHFETYLPNGQVIDPLTLLPWLGTA